MAIINYSNQLKFTGSGPLDVKNTPVKNYADLPSIPAQRYLGMEVTVLNGTGGKPEEYWFVGKDKFNGTWVRKIEGLSLSLNDEGVLTLRYNGEDIPGSSANFKTYIEDAVKQWADDNYIERGEVSVVNGSAILTLTYKDAAMAPLKISLEALSGVFATKEYVDTEIGKITASQGIQGDKGPQGDEGVQGKPGTAGASGGRGPRGAQGDAGEKGETGDKGAQGDAGEKGETGDNGAQGDAGEKGEAGDKGAQGDAGEKGEAGDKGAQGEQGVIGLQGFMGIQGFMGVQGAKGTQADKGAQGEQGVQGEKGEPGDGLTYIDEDE